MEACLQGRLTAGVMPTGKFRIALDPIQLASAIWHRWRGFSAPTQLRTTAMAFVLWVNVGKRSLNPAMTRSKENDAETICDQFGEHCGSVLLRSHLGAQEVVLQASQ